MQVISNPKPGILGKAQDETELEWSDESTAACRSMFKGFCWGTRMRLRAIPSISRWAGRELRVILMFSPERSLSFVWLFQEWKRRYLFRKPKYSGSMKRRSG